MSQGRHDHRVHMVVPEAEAEGVRDWLAENAVTLLGLDPGDVAGWFSVGLADLSEGRWLGMSCAATREQFLAFEDLAAAGAIPGHWIGGPKGEVPDFGEWAAGLPVVLERDG